MTLQMSHFYRNKNYLVPPKIIWRQFEKHWFKDLHSLGSLGFPKPIF